jgi:hypothetical protein
MSAPLALDSTAGDPPIRREDYTHPGRGSQFEIFILRIRFFDGCVFIVFGLNHPCASLVERFSLFHPAASV